MGHTRSFPREFALRRRLIYATRAVAHWTTAAAGSTAWARACPIDHNQCGSRRFGDNESYNISPYGSMRMLDIGRAHVKRRTRLPRTASGGTTNASISEIFTQLADLLEIQGANPFRIRAYRNASRTIAGLPREAAAMIAEGSDLTELPGIGEDLAGKIAEIVKSGKLTMLAAVAKQVPAGLAELLTIPALGPKRVRLLHERLKIRDIADLRKAASDGRLQTLRGFGTKTVATILEAMSKQKSGTGRLLWAKADEIAQPLVKHLQGADGMTQVIVAGSYRRRSETVGDLDILATAPKPWPVITRFLAYPETAKVLAHGTTRAAMILKSGVQVDLRVVPPASYGAALVYFTGSKAHNLALRGQAVKRGLKINEYGVFKGERRIAGRTEAEVYACLKLPEIPPELRENRGELEAAAGKQLPRLVARADLRGDLHVHTAASDGTATVKQMAEAAYQLGLAYIAIADHTPSLRVAHGLDSRRLRKQFAEIDKVNAAMSGIAILKAAEVDILPDGRLDLPDSLLKELDLAICAVHSSFDLPRDKQTERIIRAMDHPSCTILAHPSARLIGSRDALSVDMARLLREAKSRKVILEINGQPDRLDLSDIHCREGKALELKFVVSSDAHSPLQLRFLDYGIGQARRGWLEPEDIINTQPLPEFRSAIRR